MLSPSRKHERACLRPVLLQSGSVSPTPSPIGFSPSASNTTKPLSPDAMLDDAFANSMSAGSASARRRVGRRKWGALGVVAGIVVAVIRARPPAVGGRSRRADR